MLDKNHSSPFFNPLLWAAFIVYLLITGYSLLHHEMWGDEIHSWNIAKGSNTYADLINNTRYEGHPPVWYTILWTLSKFTHKLGYVQAIHWVIAVCAVFMILFVSPFSLSTRLLIPFGYYFLFEYSILSRNYAPGVLLALCICAIMLKNFRYRIPLYYLLIFLLTNTHLLAVLLAASLHLNFLMNEYQRNRSLPAVLLHGMAGIIVALPALHFIFPPSDSQLNAHFWIGKWDSHQLVTFGQGPLRAFIPVPAWWKYNSWNTQFMLEAKANFTALKALNLLVFISLLITLLLFFRKDKKVLVFFIANLTLSFVIAVLVFPLTSARYAGFLFIGFLCAYWLYTFRNTPSKKFVRLVNVLLIIQVIAGILTIVKDIHYPFSNAYRVKELVREIPSTARPVTDYWALNTIAAYVDSSFYCIDMQREASFLLWDSKLGITLKNPHRYTDGATQIFSRAGATSIELISTMSPPNLAVADSQLSKTYRVELIDERTGAMELGGNLYLYRITRY